jgi:hypothetical protein
MSTSTNNNQEEKANTQFVSHKKDIHKRTKDKRITNPIECNSTLEANRLRNQVIREISKKISIIQNKGLGEIKIRNINDEINKLLVEKGNWEDRIKDLGGQDWKVLNPETYNTEGVFKKGDYTYWGAAKELPEVNKLYKKQKPTTQVKTEQNSIYLYDKIDLSYYNGFESINKITEELDLYESNQISINCNDRLHEEFFRKINIDNNLCKLNINDDLNYFRKMHGIIGNQTKEIGINNDLNNQEKKLIENDDCGKTGEDINSIDYILMKKKKEELIERLSRETDLKLLQDH